MPIVITTGDARELYRRVGVPAAIELFRKPDDLTELRGADSRRDSRGDPRPFGVEPTRVHVLAFSRRLAR